MNYKRPFLLSLCVLLFCLCLVFFIPGKEKTKPTYDCLHPERICSDGYCFPKIIWSYWDNRIPADIEEMVRITAKSLTNLTYCFLTEKNLSNFLNVSEFPPDYFEGKYYEIWCKADYIRVLLLQKYGGVWVDSSIYINSGTEMERFINDAVKAKAQIAAFQYAMGQFEIQAAFLGAPENSFFMKRYKEEINQALLNLNEYCKRTCEYLNSNGIPLEGVRCTPYFIMDLIFTKVRFDNLTLKESALMLPQERGHMRFFKECNNVHECLIDRLLHDPLIRTHPFVKVVGPHREILRKVKETLNFDKPLPMNETHTYHLTFRLKENEDEL